MSAGHLYTRAGSVKYLPSTPLTTHARFVLLMSYVEVPAVQVITLLAQLSQHTGMNSRDRAKIVCNAVAIVGRVHTPPGGELTRVVQTLSRFAIGRRFGEGGDENEGENSKHYENANQFDQSKS